MRAFNSLLNASLKEFLREPTGLSVAVMLPLLFVFFFGFAYADQVIPAGRGAAGVRQIDYVVPGVLGLGIMWTGVFAAIPLAAQRELGILKRFGVTPLARPVLVAAQVGSRLLVSVGQTALVLLSAALFFGVPLGRSPAVMAVVVLLGTLTFVTLGYAIAAVAPTQPAAHGLAQLASMPMVFLTGVFFPLDAMPAFIQPLMWALPLTYLADGLRQAALGAAGAFPLTLDLGVLAAWTIALGAVAVRWFRWT